MDRSIWWSKELTRKESLLQLMNSESRIWSAQELESTLNISKKTIRLYLQNLDLWIHQWGGTIESTSRGFRLTIPSNISIHELLLEWIKEEISVKFYCGLFFGNFRSIEEFLEKNYITSTRFYNQTKKIREWFRSKEVEVSVHSSLHLKGKESQIRYGYFYFFWTLFKGIEWPFPIAKEPVMDAIQKSSLSLDIPLNSLQKEKIAYAIAICLIRSDQGNIVEDIYSDSSIQEDLLYASIFNAYSKLLEQNNIEEKEYQSEVSYLTLLVSVIPLSLIAESPALAFHRKIAPSIGKEVTGYVVEVLDQIGEIEPSERDYLIKRLTYLHVEAYFFHPILEKGILFTRGSAKYNRERKKLRNNLAKTLLEKVKQKINEKEYPYFMVYEAFFLTKYEELLDRSINWSTYLNPVRIQLQTDECIYTSEQLSTHINWLFLNQVVMEPINYEGTVDLVITLSNVRPETKGEVLVWNTIPTQHDWQRLYTFLDSRSYIKEN